MKFLGFWKADWKFTKLLYLILQVSFTLNFAPLLVVMRNNSFVGQTFDYLGEISPNLYFNGLILLRVYKILAEKLKRSYVSWHWRVRKNLKKNWLVVRKSNAEYGKLLPKHSKASKVGLWWDHVIQNRKCMSYMLWVIKMKNDEKREEELTCPINIVMRNLTNFDPSTRKSQKFAF